MQLLPCEARIAAGSEDWGNEFHGPQLRMKVIHYLRGTICVSKSSGRLRIGGFPNNGPPGFYSLIDAHADSLTARISSLITRSDYFCFFGVANAGFCCWLLTVSIRTDCFDELRFKKGGNCFMIARYISLLNDVVMTVGLHVPWNP